MDIMLMRSREAHHTFVASASARRSRFSGRVDLPIARAGLLEVEYESKQRAVVRAGRLRALAVTDTRRLAGVPEVPTMIEAGVAAFEATSWFAVLMLPGAASELTQRISALFNGLVNAPETREFFARISAVSFPVRRKPSRR